MNEAMFNSNKQIKISNYLSTLNHKNSFSFAYDLLFVKLGYFQFLYSDEKRWNLSYCVFFQGEYDYRFFQMNPAMI
jgi:hypothetical protein